MNPALEFRIAVVRQIRTFLEARDYREVDTPVLLTAPAPEAFIDPVPVSVRTQEGVRNRFLQTSPELPMKRLLATGWDRIFQIAPVFRDTDDTPLHRPEFRMLEWYRHCAAVSDLITECESLVQDVAALCTTHNFSNPVPNKGIPRCTVDEAFRRHAGFSILEHLDRASLQDALRKQDLIGDQNDTWSDMFFRVFLNKVEPKLLRDHPTVFLTDYPAPLASLAKISNEDSRVSERFELYVSGLEVANGFGELTDANEQRRRFEDEQARRASLGSPSPPVDEQFLAALTSMPPSVGVAFGIERLCMGLLGSTDIDEVSFLPWHAC